MDSGPEPISEADEREQLGRQAQAVYVKSFVAAAILTVIALAP